MYNIEIQILFNTESNKMILKSIGKCPEYLYIFSYLEFKKYLQSYNARANYHI